MIKKIASFSLITLFSLTILFHLLVLTAIIPYNIVWGGRLKTENDMYLFESVSLFINLLFLFFILVKSRVIQTQLSDKLVNAFLWFMVFIFLLNTVGNLLSTNEMEKMIFTPLTFITSVFCFILVLRK